MITSSARLTFTDGITMLIYPIVAGFIIRHPHGNRTPKDILLSKRHSSTTLDDLSEKWGLSLAQATVTLKSTTQKILRSAVMPLARRYQADRLFDVRRVHGMMSTDTMDARWNSIHAEKYLQVFFIKEFFVEAYPIKQKADYQEGLEIFVCMY